MWQVTRKIWCTSLSSNIIQFLQCRNGLSFGWLDNEKEVLFTYYSLFIAIPLVIIVCSTSNVITSIDCTKRIQRIGPFRRHVGSYACFTRLSGWCTILTQTLIVCQRWLSFRIGFLQFSIHKGIHVQRSQCWWCRHRRRNHRRRRSSSHQKWSATESQGVWESTWTTICHP